MALGCSCSFINDLGNKLYINERGSEIIFPIAGWITENCDNIYLPSAGYYPQLSQTKQGKYIFNNYYRISWKRNTCFFVSNGRNNNLKFTCRYVELTQSCFYTYYRNPCLQKEVN